MSLLDTVFVSCPYCGESNELVVDTTLSQQEYIEDCFVCCRPMVVKLSVDADGGIQVIAQQEDEV